MLIESSSLPNPKTSIFSSSLFWTLAIGTSITSLTIAFVKINSSPTGNFLSPLPSGQLANNQINDQQAIPTSPTPTTTMDYASSLNLAQNFLDKAYLLSRITNQSETDKQNIVDNLQQSLTYANQAISLSPQTAKGYVMRAQIFNAISTINPSATTQARADLETAQGLSNGQSVQLPEAVNPLQLLPNQQATIASDIIIAAPNDASPSASTSTKTNSNSLNGTIDLPAGETEVSIKNKSVKPDSYIYLIPQTTTNNPIFIKSKDNGTFTITTNVANTTNITIDYWIVNP